jgi:hypothetical protein
MYTGRNRWLPYPRVHGVARRRTGLLLVNTCPKCGMRYPTSFKNCLGCGTRLVNTRDGAVRKRVSRLIRNIVIIALIGGVLYGALLFIIPLLHLSVIAGQDFSAVVNTIRSPTAPPVPTYTMNQTARSANLEVTILQTREGTNLLNANLFFFITVRLLNPLKDTPVQVSGSDFVLTDAEGHTYYTYGLGDSIAQELAPQSSQSYELEYEVPRSASGLVLAVYFPQIASGSAAEPPALFAVS